MALRAGTAYVDIVPRAAKGFDDALSRDLEPGAKKAGISIGGAIGTAAGALGGALVAAKGVEFLKGAVDAASDLNEATNVTGLIFKDARGEIDSFVKSSANIGLSETKARELTGSIGGLLSNMGLAQGETVEWTKKLTTLGADMGSAFNAEPAEAIEAIGAALRGEAEPIRRFNVVLSDNAMKAEAMRLGLVKAAVDETKVANARVNVEKATAKHAETLKKYGENSLEARDSAAKLAAANDSLDKSLAGSNVELTQTQKTQATLSLITKQTAAVQGDFANTSDGLANRQRILAARMENVKAKIGSGLLPIVTKLGEVFAALFPHVEKLAAKMAPTMARITAAVKGLFDLFVKGDFTGALGKALGVEEDSAIVGHLFKIRDVGLKLAAFFTEKLVPAFRSIADFVRDHLKPILIGLAAVFILISPTAFIAALVAAYFKFEAFRNVVDSVVRFVVTKVVPAFVAAGKWIAGVFSDLVGYVKVIWPQVSEAIGHVLVVVQTVIGAFVGFVKFLWSAWGDDLLKIVGAAFNFVKDTIDNVLQVIRGIIGVVLNVINGDWGKAWDSLKQIAAGIWDQITNVVRFAFGILEGLFGGIADTLTKVWSGAWDGVKAIAHAAWKWIAENVLNPMIEGFNVAIRGINLINPGKDVPSIPLIKVEDEKKSSGTGPRAMAFGGPLAPFRDYIVGEAGRPELVRMGARGGMVLTNAPSLSGASSRGGGLHIDKLEVNGQPQPAETARSTVRELRRLAYLTGHA